MLNFDQVFSGFSQNATIIFTFSIFQGYFDHDISTVQISCKFISSNKFEVQVQHASFFATQSQYPGTAITKESFYQWMEMKRMQKAQEKVEEKKKVAL